MIENETQSEGLNEQGQDILDLGGVEQFKFNDKTLTPSDLEKVFSEHEEYSKTLHDYNRDAQYFVNLDVDLDRVKANPALADKFKSVYPERFHKFVDYVVAGGSVAKATSAAKPESKNTPELPPEIMEKLKDVDDIKSQLHQERVRAHQVEISQHLDKAVQKYPLADRDVILAKAQNILEQRGTLDGQTFEKLAKQVHESLEKTYQSYQKSKIEPQLKAGNRAKESGIGGASGPQAAKKYSSFEEATEAAIAALRGR